MKITDKFYKEYYEASKSGITQERIEKYTLAMGILKEELLNDNITFRLSNFITENKVGDNIFYSLLDMGIIKVVDRISRRYVFEWIQEKEITETQVLTCIMIMKKMTYERRTGRNYSFKNYLPKDFEDNSKKTIAKIVKSEKKRKPNSYISICWGLIKIPIKQR